MYLASSISRSGLPVDRYCSSRHRPDDPDRSAVPYRPVLSSPTANQVPNIIAQNNRRYRPTGHSRYAKLPVYCKQGRADQEGFPWQWQAERFGEQYSEQYRITVLHQIRMRCCNQVIHAQIIVVVRRYKRERVVLENPGIPVGKL